MKNEKVAVIVLLVTVLLALLGQWPANAEGPTSGAVGRYQLLLVRADGDGLVVLRIDSATGKTWKLDTTSAELATPEYIKTLGFETAYTPQKIEELRRDGYITAVPPYWTEIPERPAGINVRPTPGRR